MSTPSPVEMYLTHLDDIFQEEPIFFGGGKEDDGKPKVVSMIYPNIPEEGSISAVTYGLSLASHEAWKFGKPELCICVDSNDQAWGKVIGYLAQTQRGVRAFTYGEIINFGQPVADDSEMDAFFIYAPSFLDPEHYSDIETGRDFKINLAGVYPIYSSEIPLIQEWGFEKFWDHPDYDLYSVTRAPIQG